MIGRTVSNYRLLERLGEGGMGEVYKGLDCRLGRSVALKFVSPEIASSDTSHERFQREARIVSSLNHPNICVIHDVGEFEGRPYFVMEYIEGKDLRSLVATGPTPVEKVLSIGTQICRGLEAAHDLGIVHRDIKPSNIMLTNSGAVKILDFGLAKSPAPQEATTGASDSSTLSSFTQSGTLVGTVAYMSPEQALGKAVDHRSDLFSLGVVLYQLATGKHPFPESTLGAFFDALIHLNPPLPSSLVPGLPGTFDRIVQKALAKDPAERFGSAVEFMNELLPERATQHRLAGKPFKGLGRPWHFVSRFRYLLLSVILLVALIVAFPSGLRWFDQVLFESSLPDRKWVAVLPFELTEANLAGYRSFCDGVARDLTVELRRLEDAGQPITILPFRLFKEDQKLAVLLRESGANLALTGSLRQENANLILYLELIDTSSGKLLASERITTAIADQGKLADETIRRTVQMLRIANPLPSDGVLAREQVLPESRVALTEARGLIDRYDDPGSIDRAIQKLSRIIALNPALAEAHASLGMACIFKYRITGDPQWAARAIIEARHAVQLNPSSPSELTGLAFALSEFGRHEEALQEFAKALKLLPGSTEALRGRAESLAALGRLQEAEEAYRRVLELRPESWSGYHEMAKFHSNHGRYEEALRLMEKVQVILPDSTRVRNNIAVIYLQMQRPQLAEGLLLQSINIEPTYDAYDLLGTCAYQQGSLEKAGEWYGKALQLDPSHPEIWGNRGQIMLSLGRQDVAAASYREAVKLLRTRLEVNPDDAQARMDLADYLLELGEQVEGRRVFEAALTTPPLQHQPWLMALAGQIYERLGERARAIDWVVRALEHGYPLDRVRESPSLSGVFHDARFARRMLELNRAQQKSASDRRTDYEKLGDKSAANH